MRSRTTRVPAPERRGDFRCFEDEDDQEDQGRSRSRKDASYQERSEKDWLKAIRCEGRRGKCEDPGGGGPVQREGGRIEEEEEEASRASKKMKKLHRTSTRTRMAIVL